MILTLVTLTFQTFLSGRSNIARQLLNGGADITLLGSIEDLLTDVIRRNYLYCIRLLVSQLNATLTRGHIQFAVHRFRAPHWERESKECLQFIFSRTSLELQNSLICPHDDTCQCCPSVIMETLQLYDISKELIAIILTYNYQWGSSQPPTFRQWMLKQQLTSIQ